MLQDSPWLITTIDNPFNPHTQYNEWYAWDVANGYNTVGRIGRISYASTTIDDGDAELAQQQLVRDDVTERYVLVTNENFDALVKSLQ